jgi:hypothetical protein
MLPPANDPASATHRASIACKKLYLKYQFRHPV